MIRIVLHVVLNALVLWLVAALVPGVRHEGELISLLLAGLVMGLLNLLVKPIVTLLSLPLLILTLGLFYLVINGLMLWLMAELVSGFEVSGWLPAILGGAVFAVFNAILRGFEGSTARKRGRG